MISEAYREQNKQLHKTRPDYGTSGQKWAQQVSNLATANGITEILDYGCGKQTLGKVLPLLTVTGYDPAIEGLEQPPEPHDLVVCTDVLEHIEPEHLNAVLDDLHRVTKKLGLFSASLVPARKTLPDGRNTHLLIKEPNWWILEIMNWFDIIQFNNVGTEVVFIVKPREDGE